MEELVQKFKDHVIAKCHNPEFVHNEWFVNYHLMIVEQISMELCEKYPEANKDLVLLLVWLHDYGKIVDSKNEHEATLIKGKKKLVEIGFSGEFSKKAVSYIGTLDNKKELRNDETPIEVKIVSSADGASHFVGPFFYLWWHENPDKNFDKLIEEDKEKAVIDWSEKIILPEVKEAFRERYKLFLEQNGDFPERFLD